MATWTNIADARLEPGKPARSVDAVALRDNPIAISEGAPGAPRIQTAAIEDSAVTSQKINSVAWGKVTGRPAVVSTYYGSQYALTIPNNTTTFTYNLPSGYVATGLRGYGASGGTGMSVITQLMAYRLVTTL